MPILRANGLIVCAGLTVAVALAGCVSSLAPKEPAGVRLQGVWKLNRAASDDPQKVIDKMRAEALKRIRRELGTSAQPPMNADQGQGRRSRRGQPGGQAAGQGGTGSDDQQGRDEVAQMVAGPHYDPLRNSPMMHALSAILSRSDFLTVRQAPDQMVFDYGATVRNYTPGGHSVVSSETGVADQNSGWTGKEYVIDIKPQLGPRVTEEYGLSPDGRQLIVKLHIASFDVSKVNLTRVYDPTGQAVPNARPSNE
jgi:hypothetical protein